MDAETVRELVSLGRRLEALDQKAKADFKKIAEMDKLILEQRDRIKQLEESEQEAVKQFVQLRNKYEVPTEKKYVVTRAYAKCPECGVEDTPDKAGTLCTACATREMIFQQVVK